MSISCSCKREFRPRGGYACAASNDAAPIWKIRQSGISRSAKSRSTTVLEISAVSIAHSSRVSIPRRRPFVAFGRITGAVSANTTAGSFPPRVTHTAKVDCNVGITFADVLRPRRIVTQGSRAPDSWLRGITDHLILWFLASIHPPIEDREAVPAHLKRSIAVAEARHQVKSGERAQGFCTVALRQAFVVGDRVFRWDRHIDRAVKEQQLPGARTECVQIGVTGIDQFRYPLQLGNVLDRIKAQRVVGGVPEYHVAHELISHEEQERVGGRRR